MAFYESPRFPDYLAYGLVVGPGYATSIVRTSSGREQRNQNWSVELHEFDGSTTTRTQAERDEIDAFFRTMYGRTHGFRVKNYSDFQATVANGRLGTGAVGTGAPTYQLTKRYTSAPQTVDRSITKPVSGAVTVYRSAVAVTFGVAAGNISLDTTTGIVTFVADGSQPCASHSVGASHQFTTTLDLALVVGQKVYLSGITGTAASVLNGIAHTITAKSGAGPFTFTIGTTTTGLTASGGTAFAYPQAAEALTWAGQFDVPVRFDHDNLLWTIVDRSAGEYVYQAEQLRMVELRAA